MFFKFAFLGFYFFLLTPNSVHAYLDPGTGSYIVQLIIGVSVGASYFVATYWKKIVSFVGGLFVTKKNAVKKSEVKNTTLKNTGIHLKPSLLREMVDVWRYFKKLSKKQKRIVFYSEHKGYYPYYEGLIKKLTEDDKMVIVYISSDKNDPIFELKSNKINALYINKLLPFFMAYVDSNIFIMTLTDLNNFHLRRSVNNVHYLYVFHSMVSTHMSYRDEAFNHYNSLLCVGPHQVNEIREYEKLKELDNKTLIKAGYYRLERIYNDFKRSHKSGKNKTILIAPSWGDNNILKVCGKDIVKKLLNQSYRVIVRPHPETVKRDPQLLKEYIKEFASNLNFVLEDSIVTDKSLIESDVLITDSSGVSLEYAFGTERPVLFIDVPPKIKNAKYNELKSEPIELSLREKIGRIVSVKKISRISDDIKHLIRNRNMYKKNIIQLRSKYVFNFGKASDIGAKHIKQLLIEKS